ncbi:MAG TPA: GTP cyclohydrolase FolE2 [Xanthomonadaceae bacterium]|jgi:GTP cyclohydrolase I|nr:GTP cyclohydrolase FolE2 [Xanthomonadaceae bacterium]
MSTDQHSDPTFAGHAEHATSALPDIASDRAANNSGALDWVGMDAIDLPVLLARESLLAQESLVADRSVVAEGCAFGVGTGEVRVPARVSAEVDLRAGATRGIHMSRLYLALDSALTNEPLTPTMLHALLRNFLANHAGLSSRARVRIAFECFLRRLALASGHSGWRRYPMTITATLAQGVFALEVAFDVVYSSTCPASTALARQLVAEDFGRAFPAHGALDRDAAMRWLASEHGMRATPHSQRSTAHIRVQLDPVVAVLPFAALIDRAEAALATPVQTAVKRLDEQAFARRNGENLMFCEDAARRLQAAFDQEPFVSDFHLHVAHHESLHAHDAVAEAGKLIVDR